MITVSFFLSGRSSTMFDFILELNMTKAPTSVRITVAVLVIHNYSSH